MSFEDFLKWHNINLKIENLPSYIKGFAYYNGSQYLVLINAKCSNIQQDETTVHELIHIFENHFTCSATYQDQCENEVKYLVKEMKQQYMTEFK